MPYATGFVLSPGSQFTIEELDPLNNEDMFLPLSVQFAYGLLNNKKAFTFHTQNKSFQLSSSS